MKLRSILALMVVLSISFTILAQNRIEPIKYTGIHTYDANRNADKDIKDAIVEAQKANKRILLEVGGSWCIWCRIMDDFFEKESELKALRDEKFIVVKINYSPENNNQDALSHYPTITGYPHIFVLDENGKLLHSQNTEQLESGKSYGLEKFSGFLKKWSSNQ